MEPVHTCKLFGAIRAILGIKNALPIIHGPAGCSYHIRYLLGLRSGSNLQLCSTELTQEDVVFGAEEKLSHTILEADNLYSPDLIVVLSSCSTSLIGENIFRVAKECKPKIKSEIIAISAGGFEGDQTDGYIEVMMALIEWSISKIKLDNSNEESLNSLKNNYLAADRFKKRIPAVNETNKPHILESDTQLRKNKIFPHRNKFLNLIGIFRGGFDLFNLKKTLKRMGVTLNCVLTAGSTLEDLKRIHRANLNYSLCDISGIEPSLLLKERFSTEFMHYPFPLGFSNSYNFFKNIIDFLEIEYSLENEKNEYYGVMKNYKDKLAGYKVAIIAGPTRGTALMDFTIELGMKPVLISLDLLGSYTMENLNKIIVDCDVSPGDKPEILQKPDLMQIRDLINHSKPDLIVGGMGELGLSNEFEIPLLDVMHAQEITMGWEGAVKTAENIYDVLDSGQK
ncbi:nitrogenase component 1 [Methanobacterium alcaliphilum]|uniref:nitrogenase component 1 n=1 Tax=Methanobacterium alcaliphilum TaxID=392018 RepID=UPI00200B1205|nr:nitrogenase component 1 [Methanobacterium alcaliphilum]MCK9152365.1 nitrogenase component 1 [Methanobacterium alcaliphilum]